MCKYWNYLKASSKESAFLYTTKNNMNYLLYSFSVNRSKEEVLKYSIPKRNGLGFNYKSIPAKVFCVAIKDFRNNIDINTQWMKENFLEVDNAGGCNIKVLQSILKVYASVVGGK